MRYTELNPVRARMVSSPEAYRWSSAGAHCGIAQADLTLDTELWSQQWDCKTWKEYLRDPGAEVDAEAIRQCTHTGRPLGTKEFIQSLEESLGRILTPQRGGRRAKSTNLNQELFEFD